MENAVLSRNITALAEESLDTFPCIVIQGARQVGKSTLASILAQSHGGTNVTMDDPAAFNAAVEDPAGFIEAYSRELLVIDEVQRVPQLILPIKASIDRRRQPGRFILTGSSDLLRLQDSPDSLAGRAVTVPLSGFSQGELRGVHEDFIGHLCSGTNLNRYVAEMTRSDVATRIISGGYPEVQNLTPRMRQQWFDSYIDRLFRRDARDVRVRSNEERLATVARILAANQSGELVKSRVARDARIPETSLNATLDTLETLYVVEKLRPWTPNLTSREISRPKVFVADSGLATHLSRLGNEPLADPIYGKHLGPLLEGFVVGELKKQSTWSDTRFELFHWRDRDGHEVDVIVELDDGSIFGFEVKATASPAGKHFVGLRLLQEKLGKRFRGGLLLHLGERSLSFGNQMWALPVDTLWNL